jgi:hypothetical protein
MRRCLLLLWSPLAQGGNELSSEAGASVRAPSLAMRCERVNQCKSPKNAELFQNLGCLAWRAWSMCCEERVWGRTQHVPVEA